jgi:hypothetical protein
LEIINPYYMVFNMEFLYVCDSDSKSILKLDSNLKLCAKYILEIEPRQIRILNNLACITSSAKNQFFYFYDLLDFSMKYKYSRRTFSIIHDNNFMVLNIDEMLIDYYNKNGSLNAYKSNDEFAKFVFFVIDDNQLFIHMYNKKMLVV